MNGLFLLLLFLIPAVLTAILIPPAIQLGRTLGAVNLIEDPHLRTISRLGGVAVFIGFLAGLGISTFSSLYPLPGFPTPLFLLGAFLLLVMGLMDDIRGWGVVPKLLFQAGAIALLVIPGNVHIQYITHPLTGESLPLGTWSYPVTFAWLLLMTNAYNLIDGLDGLAAILAVIPLAVLSTTLVYHGLAPYLLLTLPLLGALIAFLPFNFPPARIHLGDSGSHLLGYTLGTVALVSGTKSATTFAVFAPLALFTLPIADVVFAILRRSTAPHLSLKERLLRIFRGDEGHIHHRILAWTGSKRRALGVLGSVATLFALLGLVLALVRNPALAFLVLMAFTALALGILFWFVRSLREAP